MHEFYSHINQAGDGLAALVGKKALKAVGFDPVRTILEQSNHTCLIGSPTYPVTRHPEGANIL